ncbi:transmembrane protein, putative, partial [Bodo saltans]
DPKTPLVTATTFELTFTMVCNGSAMLLITVTVPAPGATVLYAEQVEASGRYFQVASLLAGGASSGTALGRMMAIRSMVLCSADSAVSGGVLDFDLRICVGRSSGDSGAAAVAARSAIVSNQHEEEQHRTHKPHNHRDTQTVTACWYYLRRA